MPRAPLPRRLLLVPLLVLAPSVAAADDIARDVREARTSLEKKDYDGAIRRLDATIARHPELADVPLPYGVRAWVRHPHNLVDAYVLRAEANLSKKDWNRVLADSERAIALHSNRRDLQVFTAVAQMNRQDYPAARAAIDAAIRTDPGDKDLRLVRPMISLLAGDETRALAEFDECLQSSRAQPLIYLLRGQVFLTQRRHDMAFADMAECIRLEPHNPTGLLMRSQARRSLGQFAEALHDADELVRLHPKLAMAWDNRGTIALAARQYDRAIADLTEAIRLEPQNGIHRQLRADARWESRDQAGALADIDHAAPLLPGQPAPPRMQAYFLASATDPKLRDGARALKLATTSLERTRTEPALSLQALAAAQAEVGQLPQAVATATEALRLARGDAPTGWKLATGPGRQIMVGHASPNQSSDALARRIEHDLVRYRQGLPNRFE